MISLRQQAGPGQISSGPAISIPTPSSGWKVKSFFFKNELGLDHNESRSWHGWHRHVSLVMLAFAMMATIRHEANAALPKRRAGQDREPAAHPLVGSGIRRIATRLARRHIHPAHVIAWSLWRRAHQAVAQRAHLKSKMQM
ncbi:unnamed protein product [Ciceribacter sp. T2.26MG-112.2]|jgi:hypothetical protein|nr:unnamed protein product [Ciceribacter naphthalenivorans]SSX47263.1 unnamed protein product [Ciceribacter naphthalenivorans]